MNTIPAFVVTGFLESGKTTFINWLMNKHNWRTSNILVLQFESGETDFNDTYSNCHRIDFSQELLGNQIEEIQKQIEDTISKYSFDEIWIEWNGMIPFSQLESLLSVSSLHKLCKLQKVMHVADARNIENLLGHTGNALPQQIMNSDFITVHSIPSSHSFHSIRKLFKNINPSASVYSINEYKELCKCIYAKKEHPVSSFFIVTLILFLFSFLLRPLWEMLRIPVDAFMNLFLGIILQAIPFLLIGVIISSAIQIFIPQNFIERRFPKSLIPGMFIAILGGFCLPVCDCASIPIFRSLIKKGIPLPVAVTFMASAPVINPLVMLSTYYAFNGNKMIVIERTILGIIIGVTIGLLIELFSSNKSVFSAKRVYRSFCNCNYYEDLNGDSTWKKKISLFIRHSQDEFFNIGKFLLIGTFIASVFQILGTDFFTSAKNGVQLGVSIIIMMIMAFVLSLCSSSDAIIARSFSNQFPMPAIMGFLLFGPIMDIKNVLMLSSEFSKRFIIKLLCITFLTCFFITFLFYSIGGI